jgi:hypothetical protein
MTTITKISKTQYELIEDIRKNQCEDVYKEIARLESKFVNPTENEAIYKTIRSFAFVPDPLTAQRILLQGHAIKNILKETHHVFFHASASKFLPCTYFLKALSIHRTSHFKPLRLPQHLLMQLVDVQAFIGKSDRTDHSPEARRVLISADGYLSSDTGCESAIYYLCNNTNVLSSSSMEHFYTDLISQAYPSLGIEKSSEFSKALLKVTDIYQAYCGNLFVICIPKEESLKVQYRSHSMGKVCDCHPDQDDMQILDRLQKSELTNETLCKDEAIPQYRIFAPALDPNKHCIYLLTPYQKIQRKSMKERVRYIVSEIEKVVIDPTYPSVFLPL